MSTGQDNDHLAESRPAQAGPETASRSRFQSSLRTTIAVVFCTGVLWWTVQTVLTDNPAAKSAIRRMGSWNASERVGAIQELEIAGLGSSKIAIPPLIVALGDKDARVRTASAVALGPIGSDAASSGGKQEAVRTTIMALLGSLKDPESSVRAAAANALMTLPVGGKLGFVDPGAVMAILVERLGDPDAPTRLSVIQIMTALGPWAESDPPQELVAALRDETASIRALAVVALGSFPRNLDPMIPSLLRMMEHDEPVVRGACAAVLHRMSAPSNFTAAIVPELIAALGPPDRTGRVLACSMLEKLGPEARAAIPSLIVMAREMRSEAVGSNRSDEFPDVQAIGALRRIAPKSESAGQVVAVLTEFVRADASHKGRMAAYALGAFGPDAESAVPELIRAIRKNPEMDARNADEITFRNRTTRRRGNRERISNAFRA